MKKQKRLDLLRIYSILFALSVFVCCAHQPGENDVFTGMPEAEKSAGGGLGPDSSEGMDVTEKSADLTDTGVAASSPTSSQGEEAKSPEPSSKKDAPKAASPALLETDATKLPEETDKLATAETSSADSKSNIADRSPQSEAAPETKIADPANAVPQEASFAEPTVAEMMKDSATGSKESKSSVGEPGGPKTKAKAAVKHVTAKVANSSAPSLPNQALDRDGAKLNRYYFLRAGDTAESVSTLIYGSSSRADDLTSWNKGAWTTGKAVFFTSPINPTAEDMISMYQEAGETTESYSVQQGDSLSSIAKGKYGDTKSWREIAAINEIQRPDKIEPGQPLTLYSMEIKGYAEAKKESKVSENRPVPAPAKTPAATPITAPSAESKLDAMPNPKTAEAAVDEEDVGENKQGPTKLSPEMPTPESMKPDEKLASMEVAHPSRTTPMGIFLGGVVAALAFAFLLARRNRRKSVDYIE